MWINGEYNVYISFCPWSGVDIQRLLFHWIGCDIQTNSVAKIQRQNQRLLAWSLSIVSNNLSPFFHGNIYLNRNWKPFSFLSPGLCLSNIHHYNHQRHRTWSTLVQVIACCLTTPSHYLRQGEATMDEDLLHPHGNIFCGKCSSYQSLKCICKCTFKIFPEPMSFTVQRLCPDWLPSEHYHMNRLCRGEPRPQAVPDTVSSALLGCLGIQHSHLLPMGDYNTCTAMEWSTGIYSIFILE